MNCTSNNFSVARASLLFLFCLFINIAAIAGSATATVNGINYIVYYSVSDGVATAESATVGNNQDYTGTQLIIPASIIHTVMYTVKDPETGKYVERSSTLSFPVTKIETEAFYHCEITYLSIGESVSNIGQWAFSCAPKTLVWNAKNCYSSYSHSHYGIDYCDVENVQIGASVETLPIGFCSNSKITSVSFPNSVTTIRGFNNCEGLTGIYIPSSVTEISWTDDFGNWDHYRYWSFMGCYNLTSIKVDGANPVYDSRDNCNAIIKTNTNQLVVACKNTVLPNTLEILNYNALHNLDITNIHFPASLTRIRHNMEVIDGANSTEAHIVWAYIDNWFSDGYFCCLPFVGNKTLASITVDPDNPVFDSRDNCNALIISEWSGFITGICNSFIPNTIEVICGGAFNESGPSRLVIPTSVTDIYNDLGGTFTGCRDLESIVVEPGNTVYDSRQNCNAIIISESNELILGCRNTVIPNTVVGISGDGFVTCGKNIDIPSSVTYIKSGFQKSAELESITCRSVTPPNVWDGLFYGYEWNEEDAGYEQVTLYVPLSAVQAYRDHRVWGKFHNIVGINESSIVGDVNGDGEVTIADVNDIIERIINIHIQTGLIQYDVNGDKEVNIADVNTIIHIILSK